MREFAEWLQHTPPSVAIQSAFWFIRLLQATHLITAGVVAVSGIMIALRVLGLVRLEETIGATWQRFAPWLARGVAAMLVTGLLQVLGDPVREFTSTSFWVKVTLVISAVAGTRRVARMSMGAPLRASPLGTRLLAAFLILVWLAIPLLGRMIAYDRAIWGSLSLRS